MIYTDTSPVICWILWPLEMVSTQVTGYNVKVYICPTITRFFCRSKVRSLVKVKSLRAETTIQFTMITSFPTVKHRTCCTIDNTWGLVSDTLLCYIVLADKAAKVVEVLNKINWLTIINYDRCIWGGINDITCVLEALMFKPVCFAKVSSLSVFSCGCCSFKERAARSSAKSRSSCWEKRVHQMPLGLSAVAFRMTQSMAIRKRMVEMMQPCRTPDSTGSHSDKFLSTITLHSNCW